ncbi:MAG: RNA polymerase sigma factor [Planctomycetota bacterium]
MTKTERSPEELALEAQRGSKAAFGELVERLQEPLYNFLLVRMRNPADAEELTQESFLRAWSRLATYNPTWRFSTWLFTVARNLAVSHHRAARPESELTNEQLGGEEQDPSLDLARTELRTTVWTLAARVLSAEQRTALWLRYAEDLAPLEIARVLDRRPSSVRVLLFRARERLSAHLSPDGAEAGPSPTNIPIPGDA